MGDRPHPADYMTDAQYEQFRRDGGVSDVSMEAVILNYTKSPDERLIVHQFSGAEDELRGSHPDIAEAFENTEDEDIGDLKGGDWVTVVDGEVVETGEFHPGHIDVQVF